MAPCNLHVPGGFGNFVMSFLPFLASITLVFSSRRLYLFLTEGHHQDSDTTLLSMIKSAAFAAPASTFLAQRISSGYVLFIGTLLTTLGATLPLFIGDAHTQESAFVVLYGSGTSIIFQATFPAVSAVFRANIVSSILILGLSSVIMTVIHHLLDGAIMLFHRHVLLGLLVFLVIMCLFPAFADILQASRLQTEEKMDADHVWLVKPNIAQGDTKGEVFKVSLTERDANSTVNVKHEVMRAFCTFLMWAVGVHLSCFITASEETSSTVSIVSLVCIVSLTIFVITKFIIGRVTAYHTDYGSRTNAGYFILGLLGLASLILTFYPKVIDVHCYVLLFVISLFHQLRPDVACKIPKNYDQPAKIISQCCTELIFTLCAMIIGYFLSYLVYYKTVPPGLSRNFSYVSLSGLATVMVLISVRYSIKGKKSSFTTAAASESEA